MHTRITPAVTLEGPPVEIARPLCVKTISPLALHLVEKLGPIAVLEFYAALITHLALDANIALGTAEIEQIVQSAMKQVHRQPRQDSVFPGEVQH